MSQIYKLLINRTMAYIRTEQVAEMRKAIRKEFPEFKFSIRKNSNSSGIDVVMLETPYSFVELYDLEKVAKSYRQRAFDFEGCKTYEETEKWATEQIGKDSEKFYNGEYRENVNHYYLDMYGGKIEEVFGKIYQIVNRGNHDNSDSMTDYFDVGWYVNFGVGEYEKPLRFTGDKE